ncbi:MAG: hypothetical protein KDD82_18580 [Planctomycetes bacterium]|nr:hypothetical protein [Planctomycetota bacterium]
MTEDATPSEAPTKEELKRALKAFKKRLKLYRQDDESSLNVGPLSGGRSSGIVGIRLPEGFPDEVWKALEAKNRIKRVPGTQTYGIVPQD